MNKAQLKSMWIGISVVIIMALFPPWTGSKNNSPVGFAGYSLIYKHPKYTVPAHRIRTTDRNGKETIINNSRTRRSYSQAQVDYRLLCLHIFLVLLITSGSILTQASKGTQQQRCVTHT